MPAILSDMTALALVLLAVGAAAQATKYEAFDVDRRPSRRDALVLAAVGAAVSAALRSGVAAVAFAGALAGSAVAALLWLDAVLFRVFTIELGPRAAGDVIVAVLWRELAELDFARRFFASRRAFLLVPAIVPAVAVTVLLDGKWRILSAIFAGIALLASARGARAIAATAGAALVAAAALPTGIALAVAAVALAFAVTRLRGGEGPAGAAHFFVARAPGPARDFAPRDAHAALLDARPAPFAPSTKHGLLAGADVVLLTFESVGRDHLARHADGAAATPFYDALASRALVSRCHCCVTPTTSDAHHALYAGTYAGGTATASHVRDLAGAGWRTAYLTTARTADYGLRRLLDGAGFEVVVDGATLGGATDVALPSDGVAALARILADRKRAPLFLHVHASGTHLPYRVVDGERFARHDAADDRGRFLNAVEECDAVFARLVDELTARGLVRDPLVVVSSDHGQAFGALGYQSHGSAVVKDELCVPLALAHPRLDAGEVAFSSHFDVLPTVLDLVGVRASAPSWGASLVGPRARPSLLVTAGHPSRSTTTHFGLILDEEKLMLDLVLDRCWRTDLDDRAPVRLDGNDKRYVQALVARVAASRGVR